MSPRTTIHLVRHGRVDNPNHIVYVDLPGFDLDAVGVLEAHQAGLFLATRTIGRVVTSPLVRAVHTATAIARHHGLRSLVDDRLTEWDLSPRWAGLRWEELSDVAPGELDAYLADPTDLPFATETLSARVRRLDQAIVEHAVSDSETVFVSHQDPVAAASIALTGGNLGNLRRDPPGHGSVITLTLDGTSWSAVSSWEPGPR